jgi:hypothetical protein
VAHLALLERAWALFRAATTLRDADDLTGAAGLAYQAFDLGSKALAHAIDGAAPGTHRGRMRRAEQLLTRHTEKFDFLWRVRQKDFYGDVTPGGRAETPSDEEIREALAVVDDVLREIDRVLHDR